MNNVEVYYGIDSNSGRYTIYPSRNQGLTYTNWRISADVYWYEVSNEELKAGLKDGDYRVKDGKLFRKG